MRSSFVILAALATLAACSSTPKPEPQVGVSEGTPTLGKPVSFSYDSLDERKVSSESARGRLAVLAFVTTWDVNSQAQVDFLVAMAKNDEDRVYYAMISLDDRKNRELVEAYAKTLHVTFPVAMADAETVAGRGAFGSLTVPTVIVLDRENKVVFRKVGLAKSDELRAHMK